MMGLAASDTWSLSSHWQRVSSPADLQALFQALLIKLSQSPACMLLRVIQQGVRGPLLVQYQESMFPLLPSPSLQIRNGCGAH